MTISKLNYSKMDSASLLRRYNNHKECDDLNIITELLIKRDKLPVVQITENEIIAEICKETATDMPNENTNTMTSENTITFDNDNTELYKKIITDDKKIIEVIINLNRSIILNDRVTFNIKYKNSKGLEKNSDASGTVKSLFYGKNKKNIYAYVSVNNVLVTKSISSLSVIY